MKISRMFRNIAKRYYSKEYRIIHSNSVFGKLLSRQKILNKDVYMKETTPDILSKIYKSIDRFNFLASNAETEDEYEEFDKLEDTIRDYIQKYQLPESLQQRIIESGSIYFDLDVPSYQPLSKELIVKIEWMLHSEFHVECLLENPNLSSEIKTYIRMFI